VYSVWCSGKARRVQPHGLEVTTQSRGVAHRHQRLCIARQHLVQIAAQPCLRSSPRQSQQCLKKATLQCKVNVAAQIGHIRRQPKGRDIALSQAAQKEVALDRTYQLTYAHAEEPEPHLASSRRPGLLVEVGAHTAGEQETAGSRLIVHSPLDGASTAGTACYSSSKIGSVRSAQRRIRVGTKRRCLSLTVHPNQRGSVTTASGRLAGGSRRGDQQRRELLEEFGYGVVELLGT